MARVAGRTISWGTLAGLSLLAATHPSACSPEDAGDGSVASAAVLEVLAEVGPRAVLPALDTFLAESALLVTATQAWSDALSADEDGSIEKQAAQAQWMATMAAWQALEVMQLGPAASSLTAAGGEDLRDEIYSWPVVNPCRVDQETVLGEWDAPDFFSERLVNSYGLDALEQVLFAGADNACPSQVDINEDGSWAALGTDGVQRQRAAFAVALSAHVLDQGTALRERWDPAGGDFSGTLAQGSTPYDDDIDALNAVFDALFYLETQTKDAKLATPLGLLDCDTETCPEAVELYTSGTSTAAILANLRGFRTLFSGADGYGMDDLLAELGHGDLATDILAGLDAAEAAALALGDQPLSEAIAQQPQAVTDLYTATKAVSDLLKGDLATVLVMQIPDEAAGDND